MLAASTQPQFTTQAFDGRSRLVRPHLVFDNGVLAVQHVDELGVVAAGHAADPAGDRGCSTR
jgi:hypothetical protein